VYSISLSERPSTQAPLTLKTEDWQSAFAANGITAKTTGFPWWMYRLLAMVSPSLKEVMKMRYLWQQRIVLDGQKISDALGEDLKKTPLTKIVEQLNLVTPRSQTEPVIAARSA
jgi:hypothetical protein